MQDKTLIIDSGYGVKDIDTNEYFCGMNKWDKQLRKAVIYHSVRYAEQTINDSRFKNRNMKYVPVEIREVRE